jgi:hypothetical protein
MTGRRRPALRIGFMLALAGGGLLSQAPALIGAVWGAELGIVLSCSFERAEAQEAKRFCQTLRAGLDKAYPNQFRLKQPRSGGGFRYLEVVVERRGERLARATISHGRAAFHRFMEKGRSEVWIETVDAALRADAAGALVHPIGLALGLTR